MRTTNIHALLHPDAPVIGYIGQGIEPKPVLAKRARTHPRRWRKVVLHDAVEVGDEANYFAQEERGHAIRAGHPLLNAEGLPVNLLEDPEVVEARARAVALLDDGEAAAEPAIRAEQATATGRQIRLPGSHPVWRLDVRQHRTAAPPDGFREVPDDGADTAPLLDPAPDGASDLLSRFAVVTTPRGLRAIADAETMWASGPRARWNPDATAGHFINDGTAEIRLPRRVVGAVLDRHVPGATDQLAAMPGMEPGRKDSLVLSTRDPEQLRELATTLLTFAVTVDASTAKPTRQATTSHDTQQVLLRASQALVLANQLAA